MNKCLNCEKDVKNKYCGVSCQNEHRATLNIINYNVSPKKCLKCEVIIPYNLRRNNFCSQSCGVSFTNRKRPASFKTNQSLISKLTDEELLKCLDESENIITFFRKIGYKNRPNSTNINEVNLRLELYNKNLNDIKWGEDIRSRTKGELFKSRSNWQSARSSIQKDARKQYELSHKNKSCLICNYDIHYEIAHKKSVASHSDDILISEINNIDNLIALCRNHHWEYDNNLISL